MVYGFPAISGLTYTVTVSHESGQSNVIDGSFNVSPDGLFVAGSVNIPLNVSVVNCSVNQSQFNVHYSIPANIEVESSSIGPVLQTNTITIFKGSTQGYWVFNAAYNVTSDLTFYRNGNVRVATMAKGTKKSQGFLPSSTSEYTVSPSQDSTYRYVIQQ